MSPLIKSVELYVRKQQLLEAGDRIGVAISGGADSVALLLAMEELRSELGIVLSAVHFNHKLRGNESDKDEEFVLTLAKQHRLEFLCDCADVAQHAKNHHKSLETAAKELRYEYFSRLLRTTGLNRIATAHTLDDQAETVLMKLCRGAGTRGLSGIYPTMEVIPGKSIVRPFLGVCRKDVESYLISEGQPWREDQSNLDMRHSRNRVRHVILPALEKELNPAVRETLADTSEIARAEEEYWGALLLTALPEVWQRSSNGTGGTLEGVVLANQPLALQRRLVRAIAENLSFHLEFKHVEQVLLLASSDHGENSSAVLPEGWMAVRREGKISFRKDIAEKECGDYEYILSVPGRVLIAEAGKIVEAELVQVDDESRYNPNHAIDAGLIANELRVRNWRPGDRFWPGHSKRSKKIKELLQDRHLTSADRKRCPVVVSGAEVIWFLGCPVPASLRPRAGEAVIIRESIL